MRKFIIAVALFVLMQAALFITAIAPVTNSAVAHYTSGERAHFIAFFLTTFFLTIVLSHKIVNFRYPFLGALAYSAIVAVLVEYMQRYLTTYRTFDVYDMAWGIAGALAYVFVGKTSAYFLGDEEEKKAHKAK